MKRTLIVILLALGAGRRPEPMLVRSETVPLEQDQEHPPAVADPEPELPGIRA